MANLAINLLPQEYKLEELKRSKFYRIQTIGITAIICVALLASVSVALRFLQSQNIAKIQENLASIEGRVSAHKEAQGSLLLLKNRLSAVGKYLEIPSEGVEMYTLTSKLMPPQVTITSISIGKNGEILILAVSHDEDALEQLFNSLTSKETNEGKVKEVIIENLSRGRDGEYRLNFTITPI